MSLSAKRFIGISVLLFLAALLVVLPGFVRQLQAQEEKEALEQILKSYGVRRQNFADDIDSDGIVSIADFLIRARETVLGSCGDGVVNFNEECDDGNTSSGDTCSASCSIEVRNKSTAIEGPTKEVFMVSDQNWRDALMLLPVTTWTKGDGSVAVKPTLIYHQESGTVFDADSLIYFLRQYRPDHVTILGSPPQELADLLVARGTLGAGIDAGDISVISLSHLGSYWQDSRMVVLAQDDYETAMHASVYASLKNMPLVIVGSSLDRVETYQNKQVLCIGNELPSTVTCSSTYDVQFVQEAYYDETQTNKIVYANPSDLSISAQYTLYPKRSANPIRNLYTKTSLVAPYLAAAKHQLLLTNVSTDYSQIDSYIKQTFRDYYEGSYEGTYLTVVGAPNAVPYRIQEVPIGSWENHRSTDTTEFADFNEDFMPDIAVGRMMGLSVTDVSSQIAHTFFYDDINHGLGVKFTASSFTYMINQADRWAADFTAAGYNGVSVTKSSGAFDPVEWENQRIIMYLDHGSSSYSGIQYSQIPDLPGSLVFSDSCSTCSTYNVSSFCANSVRKGAVAYSGAVSIGWTGNMIYSGTVSGVYHRDGPLGKSFMEGYKSTNYDRYPSNAKYRWMTLLLGDPTFTPTQPYFLGADLLYY